MAQYSVGLESEDTEMEGSAPGVPGPVLLTPSVYEEDPWKIIAAKPYTAANVLHVDSGRSRVQRKRTAPPWKCPVRQLVYCGL